jgi:hypothetical protein
MTQSTIQGIGVFWERGLVIDTIKYLQLLPLLQALLLPLPRHQVPVLVLLHLQH